MTAQERTLAPVPEVAQELLARAGCLRPEHPWTTGASPAIDFGLLEQHAHLLDLSEEGLARVALSLATGRPVDLRSALGWLSRDHAELVMTAVACAAGHDRPESRIRLVEGERRVESVPPLAHWRG